MSMLISKLSSEETDLLSIKEASEWATRYLKKIVTPSNISYLVQYGKVRKSGSKGDLLVRKDDLIKYYKSYLGNRQVKWEKHLGDDLNWALSFDHLREADTTKHVHRIHPYKGKFIPQLVEYFIDSHTDNFKKKIYFKKGDILLDPFCGSGTTLVQSSESGMHAIGIDVSVFNALISNIKVTKYNSVELYSTIKKITDQLRQFISDSNTLEFEAKLLEELAIFNNKHFPSPEFKYRINHGEFNEDKYGAEKLKQFLPTYFRLVKQYKIELKQDKSNTFLDTWFLKHVRSELDFVYGKIKRIQDKNIREILSVILSRTARSCRATTHSDLATLKEPMATTYYCVKHAKICKPLFSILSWWERYGEDTVQRIAKFDGLRTPDTSQLCLTGDSRTIDIFRAIEAIDPVAAKLVKRQKIKGIFSSPPYVGLIDYHEQHAYAYDLFGFERNDKLEIGRLYEGQGKEAKASYVDGITQVLLNCKKFLVDDFDIFLVANDKFNLYPVIAEKSQMQIVNQFKRPVLNRTERDKAPYSEIIFHLKGL